MSNNLNFSQCANAKGADTNELTSYAAQMASALNSPGCQTTAASSEWGMNFALVGAGKSGPITMGGVLTGGAEGVDTSTTVLGCEQIQQIAQRNYDATEKIKCILSQTSTSIKTLSQNINKINFESRNGGLFVDCPEGLNFKQAINVKINNTNQYADSQIQDITDTLTNAAQFAATTAADSKQGWGATPQGQKVLQEAVNKTQSSDFKQQVRQTVIEITSEVKGSNEINVSVGGDIKITGKQCNITQDAVLEIIAQTMINSVMENTFKDTKETATQIINEASTKAENEGAPTLGTNLIAIVVGVIALIILLILGYYFITKEDSPAAPATTTASS